MNATHFFLGYFCVAGLYALVLCATVIWCLARAGGNYLFWVGVGVALAGYLLAQVWAWYFVCCFCGKVFRETACRIILFALLLTSFVFFMERCSLFLSGCCEGVPLFQPLIFLLDSFIARYAIQLMGGWWTLFVFHACLLFFCLESWHARGVMGSVFLMVFLGSFFSDKKTSAPPPPWLARCAVVRPPFVPGRAIDAAAHLQSVAHQMAALEPCRDLIFLPESAFPFPLCDNLPAHAALSSLSVGRTLFLGTHKRCSRGVFNAALCLCNGQEIFWHEKTHGMMGLERLPLFLQGGVLGEAVMRGLRSLVGDGFFAQAAAPKNSVLDGCFVCNGLFLAPLICSEFFYRYRVRLLVPETVIVALVNDAWFDDTCMPDLLWYVARFKSLSWGCRVLYVSYRYAGLFDATGNWSVL